MKKKTKEQYWNVYLILFRVSDKKQIESSNKTNNIFIKYGHDRSENSSPDLYSRFHFLLKKIQ